MKRVSGNPDLRLRGGDPGGNESLLLDTFSDAIVRGRDADDGELARRMTRFFLAHYEAVWTPPEDLRRDVEEQVREKRLLIAVDFWD